MKGPSVRPGVRENYGQYSGQSLELPKLNFRDEQGYRRKEMFTDWAEKYADALKSGGMTQTQLRKYYNDVKALEARIDADPDKDFKKYEALIGLLRAKAAYGSARADKNTKRGFDVLVNMIDQGVNWSTNQERFEDFVLFFEAVLGFFKGRQ